MSSNGTVGVPGGVPGVQNPIFELRPDAQGEALCLVCPW
jgi:hypothetical protein